MNHSLGTVLCGLCMAMLLLLAGCSGMLPKNYGTMAPDTNTTKAFDACRIDPAFHYYISGSDVHPNALLGLDKTLTLDSNLWKKIEPTPQAFCDMIRNMQMKALDIRQSQHGFIIRDAHGTPIGVWYSILRATTIVETKTDRQVVIYTPDIDTYEYNKR